METLLLQLNSRPGYRVTGLTTCDRGDLHEVLEAAGIPFTCHVIPESPRLLYYLKHLIFLVRFCKKNNIHYIHSHLQQVNIIAVFAQYFIRAKVIIFRHHFQYVSNSSYTEKVSRMQQLFDRIINRLAHIIVVPSGGVKEGMLKEEGANESKIRVLPYIYDFSGYKKPDPVAVAAIKGKYPAALRLIMVSRLVKLKQHRLVFPVIKELAELGLDIRLLVLDEGPEEASLKDWIAENKMENHIIMLGFRRDFINFMAASDILVQPSLTDASNSVAKEMALLEKIIMVTEHVGDYSDYVSDGVNGFLIPAVRPEVKIRDIIMAVYDNKEKYHTLGIRLKEDVTRMFGVENSRDIINGYFDLMR